MTRTLLLTGLMLLATLGLHAQNVVLQGKVTDAENSSPLNNAAVVLSGTGQLAATDASGDFSFSNVKPGKYTLVVTQAGYFPAEVSVELKNNEKPVLSITMKRDPSVPAAVNGAEIPTISLDEGEQDPDGAGEVANLLHANRDIFQSIAGFGWFFRRFRERGYDSDNFPVYLNGSIANDPESGFTFFSEFAGLNDVMRYRENTVGLEASEFAFGGVGGASFIDTRASRQRKQIRVSYASTNRIYRNRLMFTASTGLMPGGWAVSVSASKRWADEGYVPGTYFDGYSYFLSADKIFNEKHALNITALGAPSKRGRTADSFEEMMEIAGTNYYNPLWGYYNGEKRNSQNTYSHQPMGVLRYDYTPTRKTTVTVSAQAQTGKNSITRLNWFDGTNPAPDFNRRLPSSLLDTTQADDWAAQLSADENLRQIDWFALWEANQNNITSVNDAEGVLGNTVTGKKAVYIVEETRSDSREYGFNLVAKHTLTDRINLNGGANYVWYTGQNFKTVNDLLGADYWLDKDFFSIFESDASSTSGNSNLLNPNNVVYEGETFGFNYDENIRRTNGWAQMQFAASKFQFFAAGEYNFTKMWRTGYMQNGRFPDQSLGDSETLEYTTGTVKGGVTYKINGRNYLYVNGMYGSRAPRFSDAFLSPRTRDVVLPNLVNSIVQSIEGGYQLRSPYYRIRVTGYLTEFLNETENVFGNAQSVSSVVEGINLGSLNLGDDNTFLQAPVFFGAVVLQDVDRRHAGLEFAIEAKPIPAWTFTAAVSLGRYIYTNRPKLWLSLDAGQLPILDAGEVYQKDFYVPRTPQTAGTIGARYESKRFWYASASLNFTDGMYYDFDRLRRTTRFVDGLDPDSEVWAEEIANQKKADASYTVDFFGGKSWRIYKKYFIYLNLGVNNLLNNQNVIVSGRESYRNAFRNDRTDARFYTSEVLFAPGINYFASVALRF